MNYITIVVFIYLSNIEKHAKTLINSGFALVVCIAEQCAFYAASICPIIIIMSNRIYSGQL
jgi:hypothetical protein